MKNKTLKTKLKAINIIVLEKNLDLFPINYGKVIDLLNNHTTIETLKISESITILQFCTEESENLNKIYDIFATTKEELNQKNRDLQNYIDNN